MSLPSQSPSSSPPANSKYDRSEQLTLQIAPQRPQSRSPHPYHRLKSELTQPTLSPASRALLRSQNHSESGTEADDENDALANSAEGESYIIRALPAPPFRPRKGLHPFSSLRTRNEQDTEGEGILEGEIFRLSDVGLDERMVDAVVGRRAKTRVEVRLHEQDKDKEQHELDERRRKRRAEILRRVLEGALTGSLALGVLVSQSDGVWWRLHNSERAALITQILALAAICALYPFRLAWYSWKRGASSSFWRCMRITAAFDPAPYIYPTLLPVIVALCLFRDNQSFLVPNLTLGLASVPRRLVSLKPVDFVNPLHWTLTLLPSLIAETVGGQKLHNRETISVLYLVHAYLAPLIYWISTTSLLPAELELLSVSLVNILFFSRSPVSEILSLILWVGGLGVLMFCAPFIKWGVALARIPRWRLKRTGRITQARQSFIKLLNQTLHRPQQTTRGITREIVESDADDDQVVHETPLDNHLQALKLEVITSLKQNFFPPAEVEEDETRSAVEKPVRPAFSRQDSSELKRRQRRHTLPSGHVPPPIGDGLDHFIEKPLRQRKRRFSVSTTYFMSLTYEQAVLRKWVYAIVIYGYMLLIIVGPVRYLVSRMALGGAEPFGWAISYLFGDLRDVRFFIVTRPLISSWIPLPPLPDGDSAELAEIGRGRLYSKHVLGEANTRLVLAAWCIAVIVSGLAAVSTLDFVEVDTRRKVFHGMMVVIILPTVFVDPCYVALALVVVLAIFLILDLLRAGQVPPVSRPIAQFLAPYVDGRDLKGPVVISHVFLLIGCAMPLWLSLSAATFTSDPQSPWKQWDVQVRDMGMITGVVCVGMGDAMASLIGRRYGRHKWPWSGGKSLEGSFAFAAAVTVGLVIGKAWLVYGQWADPTEEFGSWRWSETAGKAAIAGCAVSGMEAALTGGNDNVIVPVVLWIMARILDV